MMFAIGIRFLCGWSMAAADGANKQAAEWPPHPDRLFMALVAAHHETGAEPQERAALEWLERQEHPSIWASAAQSRAVVTSYVPVNDVTTPKRAAADKLDAGLLVLPEKRPRQARAFPVAIPHEPVVYVIWNELPEDERRQTLASLCAKVTSIGHSASLVQAWVADNAPIPNLVPVEGIATSRLRVPGPGRFERLGQNYASGKRPGLAPARGYAAPRSSAPAPPPAGLFDNKLLVFARVSGRSLGLESTLMLTDKLRQAVIAHCPEPVPEWVSGHAPGGGATNEPHLAFLALAHVGRAHADGKLMGAALAVPRAVDAREVERCLAGFIGAGLDSARKLFDGDRFEWIIELERSFDPPVTLRPETWTRPERRWATVTPIALDRHPKGGDAVSQIEASIAASCVRIGLPEPADVIVTATSLHTGVPHARRFPALERKSGGRLMHTHAIITFREKVNGPVILGAGRFRGYGLCRPVRYCEGE